MNTGKSQQGSYKANQALIPGRESDVSERGSAGNT
jgi:hypothetical protein